jgi:cytochrome d ubiquinol oxidase subunit II
VSDVIAAGLVLGVLAYAVFAGADFGAGFWDLTAGGAVRGRGARALIDRSIGPVWEANHTWLIYCLVVAWTAFPSAFAAVMTTLYLPLGLAALGIVLRGSGFAFRKVLVRTDQQRVTGAAFAASSVLTPFFFGTIAGGIASGRVPAAGHGDAVRSWVNPTSLLAGALAVAACAYLAAVFLTADARAAADASADAGVADDASLEVGFRRRAWAAAWACGAISVAGLAVLHADAHRLFTHLMGVALPAVVVSVCSGVAALVLIRRAAPGLVRVFAAVAVGAVIAGWGVAQYPYLLGTHSTIASVAAPHASLVALAVIVIAAILVVVPSFLLLYVLQQRASLLED